MDFVCVCGYVSEHGVHVDVYARIGTLPRCVCSILLRTQGSKAWCRCGSARGVLVRPANATGTSNVRVKRSQVRKGKHSCNVRVAAQKRPLSKTLIPNERAMQARRTRLELAGRVSFNAVRILRSAMARWMDGGRTDVHRAIDIYARIRLDLGNEVAYAA